MNLATGYYTLTVIDYEPKSLRSRRGFSGVMDSGCTDDWRVWMHGGVTHVRIKYTHVTHTARFCFRVAALLILQKYDIRET